MSYECQMYAVAFATLVVLGVRFPLVTVTRRFLEPLFCWIFRHLASVVLNLKY
ncbi:hypothetical protein JCM15765_01220 [Paradesulfitobacterium aromaticivorans]